MIPSNRTEAHSVAQLAQLDRWIVEYVTINRDLLKTTGIPCSEVIRLYHATFPFPVGNKTFGGHFLKHVDRIKNGNVSYYVLFV